MVNSIWIGLYISMIVIGERNMGIKIFYIFWKWNVGCIGYISLIKIF